MQAVAEAARLRDGIDDVPGGGLLLDPGDEVGGRGEIARGFGLEMIPLKGGGDPFQVDVQAEFDRGLAGGRRGELGGMQRLGRGPRGQRFGRGMAIGLGEDGRPGVRRRAPISFRTVAERLPTVCGLQSTDRRNPK
jgi:hypothetical protein